MKRLVLSALMLAALTACASTPSDQASGDGEIRTDGRMPGGGAHIGIGAGRWGGRSGGGIGIGLGF